MFTGKRKCVGWSVALFGLWVVALRANDLEEFSQDGVKIYAVVTESKSVATALDPGIYTYTEKGAMTLVVAGQVVSGAFRPRIHFLQTGMRNSHRYEAMAVVDGQIRLFTRHSRARSTSSVITIGGREGNGAVLDPFNQAPVDLPLIDDLRQIQKQISPLITLGEYYADALLFSLPDRNGRGSDGYTIAVLLDSMDGAHPMQLHYNPVLIDRKYHLDGKLEKCLLSSRFTGHDFGYVTDYLVRNLLSPREGDPGPLAVWRKKAAALLRSGKRSSKTDVAIPYWDAHERALRLTNFISTSSPENSEIVFDPLLNRHGIYQSADLGGITNGNLEGVDPVQFGEVLIRPDGTPHLFTEELPKSTDTLSLVGMEGGRFSFILSMDGKISRVPIVPLEHTGVPVQNVAMKVLPLSDERCLLITSWNFGKGGTPVTQVHRLFIRNGEAVPEMGLVLSRQFYKTEDLERRAHVSDGGEVKLFDSLTPVMTPSQYERARKRTPAFVDLVASLKTGTKVFSYIHPRASTPIGPIQYRAYERLRGEPSQSGFFIEVNGENVRIQTGEVVPQDKKFVAAHTNFRFRVGDSIEAAPYNLKVNALLIDTTGTKGKRVQMGFVVELIDGRAVMGVVGDTFAPETLKDIYFIPQARLRLPGEKPVRAAVYLVAVFAKKTVFYPIQLENLVKAIDKPVFPEVHPWELSKVSLTENVMKTRLRFASGNPFVLLTPELEEDDRKYCLANVFDGSDLFPNRDMEQSLRFEDGEVELPDSWGRENNWAVTPETVSNKFFASLFSKIRGAVEFRRDPFPEFLALLEEMVKRSKSSRHIVYIVPPELKEYFTLYPLAVYLRKSQDRHEWSASNLKFLFNIIRPDSANQQTVMVNLESLRGIAAGTLKVPGVVSRLEDLIAINRPEGEAGRVFRLKLPSLKSASAIPLRPTIEDAVANLTGPAPAGSEGEEEAETEPEETNAAGEEEGEDIGPLARAASGLINPHILYLLATEGRKQSLNRFRELRGNDQRIPMLLIGTEAEWKKLQDQAKIEGGAGLFDHFEQVTLTTSTEDTRLRLILGLLTSPELERMGYNFDLTGMTRKEITERSEQALRLAHYVDRWVIRHAKEFRQHPFVCLMRVLNLLEEELTTNSQFLKRRILDRATIGQVLTKVFPIALHKDWLPEEDPLRQIMDPNFIFRWDQLGHKGDHGVKERIIEVLLSQLDSNSPLTMPASILIPGDSGSGKTKLIMTLFATLGLKFWEFGATTPEQNRGAQAFYLDMSRFDDSRDQASRGQGEILGLEDALKELDEFLSSSGGPQGFVFLDDFHQAPWSVRQPFLKRLRLLANDRFYHVRGRQVPTRNIRLIISLNPTSEWARVMRYVKDKKKEATLEERILATLNETGSNDFDLSALRRFGAVVPMQKFSSSARAPALLQQANIEGNNQFTSDGNLTLVTWNAVREVARHFKNADARTFLSAAAQAIMGSSLDSAREDRAVIVVPRPRKDKRNQKRPHLDAYEEDGDPRTTEYANDVVSYELIRYPLSRSAEGKVHMLRFLVQNLRRRVYELFFKAVHEEKRTDNNLQGLVVAPLARALNDHYRTFPELLLSDLRFRPDELTDHAPEQADLSRVFGSMLDRQAQSRPKLPKVGEIPLETQGSHLWGGRQSAGNARQAVLKRHLERIGAFLNRFFAEWLALEGRSLDVLGDTSHIETWLTSIPENQDPAVLDRFAQEMRALYAAYLKDIFDSNVMRLSAPEVPFSYYEASRLFAMVLDRSLGQLPWSRTTRFLVEALSLAVEDASLASAPGVLRLLFKGEGTPFLSVDPPTLVQRFANHPSFGEPRRLDENVSHLTFMQNCALILTGDSK